MGPCPIVTIRSSSCLLQTPPKTPDKLCGNIFGVVYGEMSHVSCSPYENIGISFLETPLEKQSPNSSLNIKFNPCRVKQPLMKGNLNQRGDSSCDLRIIPNLMWDSARKHPTLNIEWVMGYPRIID